LRNPANKQTNADEIITSSAVAISANVFSHVYTNFTGHDSQSLDFGDLLTYLPDTR